MEKINKKKFAKTAILAASLTMGLSLGESLFNEAQATILSGYNRYNYGNGSYYCWAGGINYCAF